MKTAILFIGLLFCAYSSANAQSLAPSTVRQIFSLEKGDSLEYHVWTVASGCGTICNWDELKVVDSISYSNAQDTLYVFFQNQLVHFDSEPVPANPCGQCSQFFQVYNEWPVYADKWVVTSLDSNIFSYFDSLYQADNILTGLSDSVNSNPLIYNGSQQNFYNIEQGGVWGTNDIYADSIGIVYKAEGVELADNNREQLIYYHKANGSIWNIAIVYGINDMADNSHISVYPNPAADRFVIEDEQNQAARFVLYDVLSKQVMNLPLTGAATTVYRNNLPAGIYCWQVIDGGNVMMVGKLVLE